ncbi:MAG: alcohol dehydrogenase catalytic domain-containing protein, partial [Demequina sp.]
MLTIESQPRPHPAPDEVLISVVAAGVNRADILQRQGHYPAPEGTPPWPGLEVSGTVAAVGDQVSRWSVGDRVCALVPGGGYAEYVAAAQGAVLPVPHGLDVTAAAGLVEAACTVWSNLQAADAQPGQTVLIHGGSGGVGTVGIQIAKAAGMQVITTARGP